MKKLVTLVTFLALCVAGSAMAANAVRISQVYGGGGASSGSPTYNVDYVEIFNNSGAAVNIGGWTIEYASAAGNFGSSASNIFTFPAGASIKPCSYVLVADSLASSAGAPLSVTPDFKFLISASATDGNIGLFSIANTNTACGSVTGLVDKVAYGSGACPEVTAVGVLTNAKGAVRNGGGTVDTDKNVSDFTVVSNPVPRNSHSAPNTACLATPNHTSTWGAIKTIYR